MSQYTGKTFRKKLNLVQSTGTNARPWNLWTDSLHILSSPLRFLFLPFSFLNHKKKQLKSRDGKTFSLVIKCTFWSQFLKNPSTRLPIPTKLSPFLVRFSIAQVAKMRCISLLYLSVLVVCTSNIRFVRLKSPLESAMFPSQITRIHSVLPLY